MAAGVAVHEVDDDEQDDAVVGEAQAAHREHAGGDLEREAGIAQQRCRQLAAIEPAEEREGGERQRREAETLEGRQREARQMGEERAGVLRLDDLRLRDREEAGEQQDDRAVVDDEKRVQAREAVCARLPREKRGQLHINPTPLPVRRRDSPA